MGLDTVELVLEVEETFALKIPDADYVVLKTVGDMHRYILRRYELDRDRRSRTAQCVSLSMFLEARQVLSQVLPVDRRLIRPRAKLQDLIPLSLRQQTWDALQTTLCLPLPPLRLATKKLVTPALISMSLLAGMIVALTPSLSFVGAALLSIPVVLVLFLFGLSVSANRMNTQIPPSCATVADVVRIGLSRESAAVPPAEFEGNAEAVWEKLVEIISSQLLVPREKITPTASFIDDLGCD